MTVSDYCSRFFFAWKIGLIRFSEKNVTKIWKQPDFSKKRDENENCTIINHEWSVILTHGGYMR